MEDAVNPSLEASWRHPWRQDLHSGTCLAQRGDYSTAEGPGTARRSESNRL
ncbi:hypothetical protein [Halorhodospira halochloris]|uniref:hypothetical protein n=1 Tax=Halorhodospira halochloris TaxID=1052 RepID=UPI0013A581D7|nr:hypothetical protein [Halorhodospira halochloris]